MRTLIKLLIAGLLLHATWRIGEAYWEHYQFEDDVQNAAQFSGTAGSGEISQTVLNLAAEHGIPLAPENLQVSREQRRVVVSGAYVRDIQVLPRYPRPWDFSFDVTVYSFAGSAR